MTGELCASVGSSLIRPLKVLPMVIGSASHSSDRKPRPQIAVST
jgi:hypothetical protein